MVTGIQTPNTGTMYKSHSNPALLSHNLLNYTHTHTITGDDVTVLGYGSQLQILRQACDMAKEELGVSCELIDLRTILPWDEETVIQVHVFILCIIQL